MPIRRFDKTEQLAVGVGTAALTFTTATSGNRTYAAAGAEEGDQFWARIQHETLPSEWEICLATIVGGTIVRATPVESSTGAAVAFSAGNKIVSDGVPFRRVPTADGDDDIVEPEVDEDDYLKVFRPSSQRWVNLPYGQINKGDLNLRSLKGTGDGSDLAMLQAASDIAINENRWPLVIPPGEYDLGGGHWYNNFGGSDTGSPVDGMHFEGGSTANFNGDLDRPAGVLIENGVVHLGVGPNCVIDGNKVDPSHVFNSRSLIFRGIGIRGGLEVWNCQISGSIDNVYVRPTNVGGRTRGVHLVFSHTLACKSLRVQGGGPNIDGIVVDTCSDLDLIGCASNANRVGIKFVKEIVYDPPNPNGRTGSRMSGVKASSLHLEGNYQEAGIFANINRGDVHLMAFSPNMDLSTTPVIRIGHPTDPAQRTAAFALSGQIGGIRVLGDEDGDGEGPVVAPVVGSIGVKIENAGTVAIRPGTRIRALETAVYRTNACTNFQGISGVDITTDVTTPLKEDTPGSGGYEERRGGVRFFASGASRAAGHTLQIDSLRASIYQKSWKLADLPPASSSKFERFVVSDGVDGKWDVMSLDGIDYLYSDGTVARAGVWTPLAISAHAYWDTIYADSVEQTGGGGPVKSWTDIVANYVLSQLTVSAQPTFDPTRFNGSAGIYGSLDDFLRRESCVGIPTGVTGCESWWLLDQLTDPSDTMDRTIGGWGGGSVTTSRRLRRSSLGGVNRARGVDTGGLVTQLTTDFSNRRVVRQIATGTGIYIEVDGVLGTPVSQVSAIGTTRMTLFAGTATAPTDFANVGIAAWVITPLLSSGDATLLRNFLSARV